MNTNLVSLLISIIYFLFKFGEMKFITKEPKPLKILFRDTLIVFVSCMCGFFVFSQIEPITKNASNTPNVFVNDPDF